MTTYTQIPQPTRALGNTDTQLPVVGLGCMGMSDFYQGNSSVDAHQTLRHALEMGVIHWDTSDIYGPYTNERLLGELLPEVRDQVFLATKFGILRNDSGGFLGVNGKPEYVRKSCEASLKRLGVDHIDLYYQHRPDPDVPVEETVGELARLVSEGKIRHIGLSEHDAATLRRAHQEHPVAAYQGELSLWTRVHEENDVLETCQELGTTFVAYSPLGRGFLTGAIQSRDDLEQGDWRLTNPRFSEENFQKNLALVDSVNAIAQEVGATSAQICLAWAIQKHRHVITIPGTTKAKRVFENANASLVTLSDTHMDTLNALPQGFGNRYA